jgi:hypothetical protein
MILHYFFFVIAFSIGYVTGGFTVIGPLCCVRMGIPFSSRVERETGINMGRAKTKYYTSFLVWAIIDALLLLFLFRFVPTSYVQCFVFGTFLAFLVGIKETGVTINNLQDFTHFVLPLLNPDEADVFLGYIEKALDEID